MEGRLVMATAPINIFLPQSANFSYLTLDELRAEGFSPEWISDDRARRFIRDMSNWINLLTDQWFLPVRLEERTDGRNCSVVHLQNFIPILQLDEIRFVKPGLVDFVFPEIAYVVKNRYVQLLSPMASFPGLPRFVQLRGVFGYLEDTYNVVCTTLTQPAKRGDVVLHVASTEGFTEQDAILVGSKLAPASVGMEIKGVDKDDNKLIIEPLPVSNIAANETVCRYGRVPYLIKRAVMLLLQDRAEYLAAEDPSCPPWLGKRLTSESVEGYTWSARSLPADYGFGGGKWTTGNPEVDDILFQYSARMHYVGNLG